MCTNLKSWRLFFVAAGLFLCFQVAFAQKPVNSKLYNGELGLELNVPGSTATVEVKNLITNSSSVFNAVYGVTYSNFEWHAETELGDVNSSCHCTYIPADTPHQITITVHNGGSQGAESFTA